MALNVNEVAWELHCSPNTVWSLIRNCTLPSFKVNRKRLVARICLENFIAQGGTERVMTFAEPSRGSEIGAQEESDVAYKPPNTRELFEVHADIKGQRQ
ncbi:MAG: helix-turn-helix domain-containing protein [Acidimicrobiales bacterium]